MNEGELSYSMYGKVVHHPFLFDSPVEVANDGKRQRQQIS